MPGLETVPAECRGMDFDKAALRLPAKMGALLLAAYAREICAAGEQGDLPSAGRAFER